MASLDNGFSIDKLLGGDATKRAIEHRAQTERRVAPRFEHQSNQLAQPQRQIEPDSSWTGSQEPHVRYIRPEEPPIQLGMSPATQTLHDSAVMHIHQPQQQARSDEKFRQQKALWAEDVVRSSQFLNTLAGQQQLAFEQKLWDQDAERAAPFLQDYATQKWNQEDEAVADVGVMPHQQFLREIEDELQTAKSQNEIDFLREVLEAELGVTSLDDPVIDYMDYDITDWNFGGL